MRNIKTLLEKRFLAKCLQERSTCVKLRPRIIALGCCINVGLVFLLLLLAMNVNIWLCRHLPVCGSVCICVYTLKSRSFGRAKLAVAKCDVPRAAAIAGTERCEPFDGVSFKRFNSVIGSRLSNNCTKYLQTYYFFNHSAQKKLKYNDFRTSRRKISAII